MYLVSERKHGCIAVLGPLLWPEDTLGELVLSAHRGWSGLVAGAL